MGGGVKKLQRHKDVTTSRDSHNHNTHTHSGLTGDNQCDEPNSLSSGAQR